MISNYILNINKYRVSTVPQIVGRVADLPYMDFEFRLKDGDEPLDLTGCTIEFRGLTSTGHKIISANSVKVTSAKNGTIDFKVPKNFYSSPGRFKRAYFAIKKNGRIDTTQDVIIHVLESVDLNAQDAENIIDAVDDIIAKVEKQIKQDTDRLIKQIKDDTASTIADSNKKLADLDRQISDFKTNTNATISQINGQLTSITSGLNSSDARLKELEKKINDNDLVKRPEFLELRNVVNNRRIGIRNLIKRGAWYPGSGGVLDIKDDFGENLSIFHNYGSSWPRLYNNSVRDIEWIDGETYTLSFYIRANANAYKGIRVQIADSNSSNHIMSTNDLDVSTTFKRFDFTFKYKAVDTSNISLQLFVFSGESMPEKRSVFLSQPMLVEGNLTGMWYPALEDITSNLMAISLQKQIDELKKIVTALGGS